MLAASLAGMFAANRQILVTVMQQAKAQDSDDVANSAHQVLADAATATGEKSSPNSGEQGTPNQPMSLVELVHKKSAGTNDAIGKEAAKGYSIVFVGLEHPISETAQRFEIQIQRLVETFDGPVAIVLNGTTPAIEPNSQLNILVPTGGTPDARLATEIALALTKASTGMLTALHVFDPREDADILRGRARRQGMSILVDARRLGKRSGVPIKAITLTNSSPESAIRRVTRSGDYGLVVIGTSLRQGNTKFLGPRSAALVRALRTPVLLIVR